MILLIDDSEDDAVHLRSTLKEAGLDEPITWLSQAETAMDYLSGNGPYANREWHPLPNVILLDLRMPKIDGLQFLQWIKSQPQLNQIIVVLVTRLNDTKTIQLAYEHGAQSYLDKDGNLEEFQNFVAFAKCLRGISGPTFSQPPVPPGFKNAQP